jgi:hypothetical protein
MNVSSLCLPIQPNHDLEPSGLWTFPYSVGHINWRYCEAKERECQRNFQTLFLSVTKINNCEAKERECQRNFQTLFLSVTKIKNCEAKERECQRNLPGLWQVAFVQQQVTHFHQVAVQDNKVLVRHFPTDAVRSDGSRLGRLCNRNTKPSVNKWR